MPPPDPLPYDGRFETPEEYVEELLNFATTSDLFQVLCGGVHILDFFTSDPGLFHAALPAEWHEYLLSQDIMDILDMLLWIDLDELAKDPSRCPPLSLLEYVRSVRRFALGRSFKPTAQKLPVLPRSIALGMKPKKIHEVVNFADYVGKLSDDIADQHGTEISHFVDFGSGQNYLGRVLASEPYNRRVVAVEGREKNVSGAKYLDVRSGLASAPKLKRNKKLWSKIRETIGENRDDPEAKAEAIRKVAGQEEAAFDFRATNELDGIYTAEEGKGQVQYISGRLNSGDLTELLTTIEESNADEKVKKDPRLMAVSIHSCGNLSHYAIRSMILNREIRAVAIVGCCYNLLTERLGAPNYKHPYLRPTLQALNGRLWQESDKKDPQGFPMSNRFCTYKDMGVRLNITARMMACQAPLNWSREESEVFFSRHFYRAVLQRIFLDRGVVSKIRHGEPATQNDEPESPFNISTNPLIIGSLRKHCYQSLKSYIRGAIEKLTTSTEYKQYGELIQEKMGDLTDEDIERYEATYQPRRKELSIIWSMMAFSAMVCESLIVADRWMFLKEHKDLVKDAWVETVFDYGQSPRNLVVVGIKNEGV
ncbi:Methyltransferase-like protein [Paramyrothecium foliicola]|nr:Methyltransferase-like protein [Paramyrothecium foliicola]